MVRLAEADLAAAVEVEEVAEAAVVYSIWTADADSAESGRATPQSAPEVVEVAEAEGAVEACYATRRMTSRCSSGSSRSRAATVTAAEAPYAGCSVSRAAAVEAETASGNPETI